MSDDKLGCPHGCELAPLLGVLMFSLFSVFFACQRKGAKLTSCHDMAQSPILVVEVKAKVKVRVHFTLHEIIKCSYVDAYWHRQK